MKQILFITLLVLVLLPLTGQDNTLPLEVPIQKVIVTGNIHLVLVASKTQQLVFVSDQNRDALTVELGESQLKLKTKSELNKAPSINLKLYYTSLSNLEVTKGGRIQSADTLKTSALNLRVETGGKVELNIETDSLAVRINQGADVILYGRTVSQSIDAYTWGNYLGFNLDADYAYVKAATGAQVKVNAAKFLEVNSTSKAMVGYWGTPEETKIKTSVGGKVSRLTE